DRAGVAHLGRVVRILSDGEEQLAGTKKAVEPRPHVGRSARLLEHELRELLPCAELLVEPCETLAQLDVVGCGESCALETAARVRKASRLLARLRELQGRADDAFAFFDAHEAPVRRACGGPISLELVEVTDRAECRAILAVRLEELVQDISGFL